jgi:hypothetical protein
MEQQVFFDSDGFSLEGLLEWKSPDRGIVVCHPHPLFGGDMRNTVVKQVCRICWALGISTLRFNFRGTGKSQGRYDEGIGEQVDVQSAVDFLRRREIAQIDLVGYSFGAWVVANSIRKPLPVQQLILVSPPVAFMDFSTVPSLPNLKLVITGENDEIAPPVRIQKMLFLWNPDAKFEIIRGSDHFYSGCMEQLESVLKSFLFP